MKAQYLTGMLAHLLGRSADPQIASVETFEQAGAVGFHWPPHGLKVTFVDGLTVFVSCSRTSAPAEDLNSQPDQFQPEDLHVPSV